MKSVYIKVIIITIILVSIYLLIVNINNKEQKDQDSLIYSINGSITLDRSLFKSGIIGRKRTILGDLGEAIKLTKLVFNSQDSFSTGDFSSTFEISILDQYNSVNVLYKNTIPSNGSLNISRIFEIPIELKKGDKIIIDLIVEDGCTATIVNPTVELIPSYICIVSEFSEFGQCSAPCDGGIQTRTRTVLSNPDGVQCPPLAESIPCNTQPCECVVSEFSEFGQCNVPCDGGIQTRTRTVLSNPGGIQCPPLAESIPCNTQPCECKVSEFSGFGACNVPCGGGTQTRTRTVISNPGGIQCPSLTESRPCNTQLCTLSYPYVGTLGQNRVSSSTPIIGVTSTIIGTADRNYNLVDMVFSAENSTGVNPISSSISIVLLRSDLTVRQTLKADIPFPFNGGSITNTTVFGTPIFFGAGSKIRLDITTLIRASAFITNPRVTFTYT